MTVRMTCQHCRKDQDVSDIVAQDIYGVSHNDLKRFIGQYKELVDPRKQYKLRLEAYRDAGCQMLVLMKKLLAQHRHNCCDEMKDIRTFVSNLTE
jgi:hypothetical protein